MRCLGFCLLGIVTLLPGVADAQMRAVPIVRFVVPEADGLGAALAIDGDNVLLGTNAPAAYAFQYDGANWWMERLAVPGADPKAFFDSVALDEELALVGGAFTPHVYVFRFDGSTWLHEATLTDSHGDTDFGDSLDIEGDVAIVACPSRDAEIFRFDGRRWNRESRLTPKRPEARFGFANEVVLDGERVLLLKESRIGDKFEGVFAYRFDGARWRPEDTMELSESDTDTVFIGTIALDGDLALLDADYDDEVHVFRFDGAKWKREAILSPPGLDPAGDTPNFGVSVAIDGELAIVGANLDDRAGKNLGAVYVFRYTGRRWKHELTFHGEEAYNFGRRVALSDSKALVWGGGVFLYRLR